MYTVWDAQNTSFFFLTVFEIKVLFCAPSGRTGSYNVHPAACPCTTLVYRHTNSLKKRAHTGRTAQKNVRPSTEMCAPGAVCTLNFEHCILCGMHKIQVFFFFIIETNSVAMNSSSMGRSYILKTDSQ